MSGDWRVAPISVFPVPSGHGDVHHFHVARSNGESLTVAEYKAIFEFVTGHAMDPSHLACDALHFAQEDRL